jgi:hypothetical protein
MAHVDEAYSVGVETPVGVGTQSGESITEGIAAIVVIVLTILGLANVAPALLVAIATIAAGVVFMVRGSGTASIVARSGSSAVGGSFAMELLIGAAGIILGILALLQISPTDLIAIAVIAYGAAQVLAGRSSNAFAGAPPIALSNAAGLQALAGLQAIVLGILALAGFTPLVLVLIALLALGSLLFVNGVAFGDAVLTVFRR